MEGYCRRASLIAVLNGLNLKCINSNLSFRLGHFHSQPYQLHYLTYPTPHISKISNIATDCPFDPLQFLTISSTSDPLD